MPKKEKEKNFKQEFEQCEKQKEEYLAGWQRAKADFINYKKEEAERRGEIAEYISMDIILDMLPILDNFEMAGKELTDEMKENQVIKGVFHIKAQFQDFLKNRGIEEIDVLGKKFNIETAEAVGEIEGEEPGIVEEIVQKGYKFKGKVIRPAKVKVSK